MTKDTIYAILTRNVTIIRMTNILLRIVLNAALLLLASTLVKDFFFPSLDQLSAGTALWVYARAGIAMALVNVLVTPILKLLLFPLVLITFGAASALLNIIALWLLALLLPNLVITSLMGLIYGTLIISVGNLIVDWTKD